MSTASTAPAASKPAPPKLDKLRSPGYELFILVVSVMSLVNFALLVLPLHFGLDIRGLIMAMEPIITVVLLSDFGLRLREAKGHRWRYMNLEGGWLDFLGSLPFCRLLRLFRVVRVIRQFGKYGWRNVFRWFIANRASGALFMVLTLLFLVLEIGGILVLHFEAGHPGANIETGGEALWWGVVTISTVGYGNLYPVTGGGEITATVMIFAGVAIVGIFTAWAASTFLSPPSSSTIEASDEAEQQAAAVISKGPDAAHHDSRLEDLLHDMRERIDSLEAELRRHRS